MERDLGAGRRRCAASVRVALALVALVLAGHTGAHADPVFDRAEEVASLAERLVASISVLDPDAYVDLFVGEPEVRLWTDGDLHAGVDPIRESVAQLMAEHGEEEFETSSPRVLIEPTEGWLLFDWTWGPVQGTHIAKAQVVDGAWRVADVDFDGATLGVGKVRFASGDAATKIGATLDTLGEASAAFSAGDFGRVPLDIPVRATFTLSNDGDQPLQILNQPVVEVKEGC